MTRPVTVLTLEQDVARFLAFKRAMGQGYRRGEFVLKALLRFLAVRYGDRAIPMEQALTLWTARGADRKAITIGNEFGVVRQLCLFRRRSDPRCFVPEPAMAPVRESVFVPYIFSREQVRDLIDAATRHEDRSIWGGLLRALTLVLYCTGMRLGEATRLRMLDVDLRRAVLTIQRSKGRSRILPIRSDLVDELRQYLGQREKVLASPGDACDPGVLFVRRDGSALSVQVASNALRRLLRDQGLKPPRGRCGARPYELRHAFAVHRLTVWATEGVDIHQKLPWLSAYLGHLNILGTEVYLKATPELLQLASQRFAQHLQAKRRSP